MPELLCRIALVHSIFSAFLADSFLSTHSHEHSFERARCPLYRSLALNEALLRIIIVQEVEMLFFFLVFDHFGEEFPPVLVVFDLPIAEIDFGLDQRRFDAVLQVYFVLGNGLVFDLFVLLVHLLIDVPFYPVPKNSKKIGVALVVFTICIFLSFYSAPGEPLWCFSPSTSAGLGLFQVILIPF